MRLKASSLFESIVAISIIATIMALTASIFGNVIKSQTSIKQIQGLDSMDSIISIDKGFPFLESDKFEMNQCEIIRSISERKESNALLEVEYELRFNGKKVKQRTILKSIDE